MASDAAVQVSFEASTEVIGRRQVPRGDRPWKGLISVEGAELEGYEELGSGIRPPIARIWKAVGSISRCTRAGAARR